MNTNVIAWSSIHLCGLLLLGGCAASGPSYENVMANADPIADDAVRIFFLRPRDADDGSNGGAASIAVNQERVGSLRYGGFFYVDGTPGPTTLTVFGATAPWAPAKLTLQQVPNRLSTSMSAFVCLT